MPRFQGQLFADYCAVVDRLKEVAGDLGITMVQLAIAWCLRQEAVSCVLVGAKNPTQVEEHLMAAEVDLADEVIERIETILEDTPVG